MSRIQKNSMRIGHGYDVHCFEQGDHIILGGVTISHNKGIKAHSDGDVLLHAVCDALLGAMALGDIGQHFPDNAQEYKNIDSRVLLRKVSQLIHDKGYGVGNLDITIVAQAPKILPHKAAMIANLSDDLNLVVDCINIKATTTEGLGFTGREEGIAVHAVVLLQAKVSNC